MTPENPLKSSAYPVLSQSVTAVRMEPMFKQGYAKGMNWHYYALRAANKTQEKCEHFDKNVTIFDIDNVRIALTPISEGLGDKIKFNVTCALCDKLFILTSQKLTNKFIKFYGL